MAIVCIKIGENEAQTYGKFERISKDMDIVDVLPRKRDEKGNLIERTMGRVGDKRFFGLNVDMSTLTNEEFIKVRGLLREEWVELSELNDMGQEDTEPIFERLAKRLRRIDLSKISAVGIGEETKAKIELLSTKKRAREEFDCMTVNRYDRMVSFEDFAKCVVNKETGETLEKELRLSGKKIKDVVSTIETKQERLVK